MMPSETNRPPETSLTTDETNSRHSDSNTDYWGMIPSETNRPSDEVDTVIVTLTTGG